MLKNSLISTLVVLVALTSSNIFANKVKFSKTDVFGNFHCIVDTITYRFKTVDIHTSGVEVNGFCGGEEYVKTPGHITGMSMSELKKFYFEYKKNPGKEGYVNIVAGNESDVTCFPDKGKNRRKYGNGSFC